MDQDDKELKRAKNSAYRYLTIRPRSRTEVERRLRDRGFAPEIIVPVVSHLVRLGYIDDERFARDWAASRVRTRGYGRRRVERELRDRGVDAETVRRTAQELFHDVSEKDIARKEAEKKLRAMTRLPPDIQRRRLAGFLERRGFPADIIYALLRTLTGKG